DCFSAARFASSATRFASSAILRTGSRNSPQCLHFRAVALICSLQNGHSRVSAPWLPPVRPKVLGPWTERGGVVGSSNGAVQPPQRTTVPAMVSGASTATPQVGQAKEMLTDASAVESGHQEF